MLPSDPFFYEELNRLVAYAKIAPGVVLSSAAAGALVVFGAFYLVRTLLRKRKDY